MPIISHIGARSWKVRTVYGCIYFLLLLGAATMIYPLLLMLTGSVKSNADSESVTPFPKYWGNDTVLFQKYLDSKYNMDLAAVTVAWGQPLVNWPLIQPPAPTADLDDYLAWRVQCPFWELGHIRGQGTLPLNARLFRREMSAKFNQDIVAFSRAMGIAAKNWSGLFPPGQPPTRYHRVPEGLRAEFAKFAATRPVEDRNLVNLDGKFWQEYLRPKYGNDIAGYNQTHDTHHARLLDVPLARRAPAHPATRADWEAYVRHKLPLEFIRLDTPFPATAPTGQIAQVEWEANLKDPTVVPVPAIEVYGPRQMFEEFVAQRRGVPVAELEPLRLPAAAADYHDALTNKRAWRWEFTTRNYKQVFEYIALHGRGLLNTFIYCSLAVGCALIVNPLAAYALSRYKLPSTYTVLLFCLATMAFPGEVTMIPSFLLLKRFPLWPLLAGIATFLLTFYTVAKLRPRWPETVHFLGALATGLIVGYAVVPRVLAQPTLSLLNTFAALVLPGMAHGFSIFLLKGFFDSLPRELYEAAEIDGAGEWTKFWTITMNTSKPILAVTALSAFTHAYSAFMMALIIIPDQKMWTLMVWIYQLQTYSHPTVVFASLVIAAIPTFIIFVLCQNVIMRGIVVPSEK
ncbi:MAG: hypothetical protein PCFJNLEI_02212 [Verrucomicrobiae bacterium]|nr:hypothetical protein [Verrucomicrobiae bacterium]